jgi:hypothetical protein
MVGFSNLVSLVFLLFSNVGAKESIGVKEIEVDVEYTNQRRQLMWGSGGFSWFLCKLIPHLEYPHLSFTQLIFFLDRYDAFMQWTRTDMP